MWTCETNAFKRKSLYPIENQKEDSAPNRESRCPVKISSWHLCFYAAGGSHWHCSQTGSIPHFCGGSCSWKHKRKDAVACKPNTPLIYLNHRLMTWMPQDLWFWMPQEINIGILLWFCLLFHSQRFERTCHTCLGFTVHGIAYVDVSNKQMIVSIAHKDLALWQLTCLYNAMSCISQSSPSRHCPSFHSNTCPTAENLIIIWEFDACSFRQL